MMAGAQTPFGQYWYANASDKSREWLAGEYAQALRVLCPTLERRAFSAHRRREERGSRYTGGYSGGNTTIQEDPFEF